jgi:hypothetical protein
MDRVKIKKNIARKIIPTIIFLMFFLVEITAGNNRFISMLSSQAVPTKP